MEMDSPFSSDSPTVSTRMTSEEMLDRASSWTLKCDNALLNRLKDFSENLVSQAQEISQDCDTLGEEVSLLHSQVHNVTNQFLMLSNTQFVENRVEEYVETANSDENSQTFPEKTKAEKEAELISKMKEAIQIGVAANIEMEAKRLDASTLTTSLPILSLPYIIGSSKFFSSRSCGLADDTKSFVQATQEGAINSVHEFQDSVSTSSSSLGHKPEVVTNSTSTQPHSLFVRELYRPPSLNHSLDRADSVSSDDLFGSNKRPSSETSSNCNLAHAQTDAEKLPSHSVPPVLANKHKSLVNDLNGAIRAFAPPLPPVDSDESDYDFKPPGPGQDLSRKVFADIDDEDDDLFGSNSIFASKRTQAVDDDDSFFDKPAPPNPTSLFSKYNSQPPPPVLYQSTPPPPIPAQRHNSKLRTEKLNRNLFPDSPETDEEDIFAFSANKTPHQAADKDDSKTYSQTIIPPSSSANDAASSIPSPGAEPYPKSKLPYGAVSMFGNMPPPIIPTVNSTLTSEATVSDSLTKAENVPEAVKSAIVGEGEGNNATPDEIKSESKNKNPNHERKSITHKSVFDDDSSDDDLFSTKKNVNSSKNSAKSKSKSLFDDASLFGAAPNSESKPVRRDFSVSTSETEDRPELADVNPKSEDAEVPQVKDKSVLRYGAVSMFGNLPPPVIPIRKQIPDSLKDNVESSDETQSSSSPITTKPPPSIPVSTSIPITKSIVSLEPPATPEAKVHKPLSEVSSQVSSATKEPKTAIHAPETTTGIPPVRDDLMSPIPVKNAEQQNGKLDKPVLSHGFEPPPILCSSSSSDSIGSRNSRFSKSRSIFDDDSDDDLFAVKRNTEPKKKVTTTKRTTSLFDDIPPEIPTKSNQISPLFSDDSPSLTSKPNNSISITSSNDREFQKPSPHAPLHFASETSSVPSAKVASPASDDSAAITTPPVSNSADIPEETPQKRWLPAGAVSMFGNLPPPAFPTHNPTSASVRREVSSDIAHNKVQIPVPMPDPVMKPPELNIKQETPGTSKADSVNSKVIQNQTTQVSVPAKIKREVKSSIFDEDSDEYLFSGSKPSTNKKLTPTPVTTLFSDAESASKAGSYGTPRLQNADLDNKAAKEQIQPVSTSITRGTKSKSNKTVSIFDDSDSDSDIFSSTKKASSSNQSRTKIFESKAKQKPNTKSIFGNDSDEDIFTATKVAKAKGNRSKPANSNPPVESAYELTKETATMKSSISDIDVNFAEKVANVTVDANDTMVPKAVSVENQNPQISDSVVASETRITASVDDHFLDLTSDPPNLLTSIAKGRPKVGPHRRRPTRKPKSAEASSSSDLIDSVSPSTDGIIRSDPLASVQTNNGETDQFIDSGSE